MSLFMVHFLVQIKFSAIFSERILSNFKLELIIFLVTLLLMQFPVEDQRDAAENEEENAELSARR